MGQLSPHATTTKLVRLNTRARVPQTTEHTRSGACAPQLEKRKPARHTKSPRTATKDPTCLNEDPVCRN